MSAPSRESVDSNEVVQKNANAVTVSSSPWKRITPFVRRYNIELIYGSLTILGLLGLWYFVTALGILSARVLPSPHDVWVAFVSFLTEGFAGAGFAESLLSSLYLLAMGWLIAIAGGAIIGFGFATNSIFRDISYPWFHFYRGLPPLGYIGILITWFGIGDLPKILLIVLAGLPGVVIPVADAIGGVRPERLEGLSSLGISGWRMHWLVTIPTMLPALLTGMRVAFGACFIALVGAEMIASSSGLGYIVISALNFGRPDMLIAAIFIMGFIGVVADGLLKLLRRRLVPWTGRF